MAEGLLDSNENEPKSEKQELEGEAEDLSLRCGWRSCRPDSLQRFVNPKWFISAISLFSLTQGLLVNGLTSVSIPDIEKEFGFSSSSAGLILSSNDIAGIILVPIVSFLGTHGKKPKWIGYGALFTGVGALLFALPKALIGKYTIPGTGKTSPLCSLGIASNICKESPYSSSTGYLFLLCLAQFIMGAGTTPLYTLGPAYMDENVNPKVSPIYLGIWFATTFLGPGMGFAVGGAFLRTFTDLKVPEGVKLSIRDPRWIGAWWMGYFLFSWLLIISGALVLCFPKEMPKYKKKRLEALKEGALMKADEEIGKGLKSFIIATVRLLKNGTFICSVLALTVRTLYGSAVGSFFAKLLLLKFGGSTSDISLATGVILIPGMAGGIMVGAFIMKKIPVKNSAKTAALICASLSLLTIGGSASFLIPGCRTTVMAGATTPYVNSTHTDSLVSSCNADCACSRFAYAPVCGVDGKSYFSPCHAGCQTFVSKKQVAHCRCISGASFIRHAQKNMTEGPMKMIGNFNISGNTGNKNRTMSKAEANFGLCNRDCKNLPYFMLMSFLLISVVFLTATPQKMILLRCVPDNQRAFALGLQFLFLRSLSFIPGPVIFGAVIDSKCILWKKDNCGKRGNCLDYEVDALSLNIFYLGLVTGIIGTMFYFLAWWFYKPMKDDLGKKIEYNAEDGVLLADKEEADESRENGNI